MQRILLAIAIGLVASSTSYAQWPYGYPYGGAAQNPDAEKAHGMADVIRADGEAQLNRAQAGKVNEEARSLEIQNKVKHTEMFYERRRIRDQYMKETAKPRMSDEALFRAAKSNAPKRLDSSKLDPVSGTIAWPTLLLDSAHAASRTTVEAGFRAWAENDGVMPGNLYTSTVQACEVMENSLKGQISSVPSNTYLESRNFIKSLVYEAGSPD